MNIKKNQGKIPMHFKKIIPFSLVTIGALCVAGALSACSDKVAGADEQVLSALATGVFSGCIGMTDNMLPWLYSKICALAAADRFAEAAKLQDMSVRFVELILSKPNFSWPKAVMKYIGIDCGGARAPAGRPLTVDEHRELFAELDTLGFVRKVK